MSSQQLQNEIGNALRSACLELDRIRIQTALSSPTSSGWSVLDSFEWQGRRYRVSVRPLKELTPREAEVVERILRGDSNKVIAYDLGLAWSTVRVLVARATEKLGVRGRADLLAHFRRAA